MNESATMAKVTTKEAPHPGKSEIIYPPAHLMPKHAQMSRKVHEVPRVFTEGHHPSGKAGNTGLDNGQQLHAPKKHRPFEVYPETGVPPAAEQVDGDHEGPPASEHQKKKSKTRK